METNLSKWPIRLGVGLVSGLTIVYMDNWALKGEASPIFIVALLLAATVVIGALWGWRGWISAALTWACVPAAHVVKHAFGLPDTLHPNTYISILFLAAFTLVVATAGFGCGMLVRRLAKGPAEPG
jgi:hypothetical protein